MAFQFLSLNGNFPDSFDPFALKEESLFPLIINKDTGGLVTSAMIVAARAVKFDVEKIQKNNNILTNDEDLRLAITGANKFQFPSGLILFHTGNKTRNQFRNKSCCFFTSLLPHSVDYYFEGALNHANAEDEIEVRTYVLKRSVTMYQWYFTDLADMIHRKNNPGETELQRGSEEFKKAEYEANYAFEKFGLDGKYSQDSNELMFTTQSMDALVEMSEEFSMMLYLFIKNLLCDDKFEYAKRFPNILRLSYPERLLFLDYIQAMEQFMVHEGVIDDSTAFTASDYGGVEDETKLLATVHKELMMFFAERDKKFRAYLSKDRAKFHPDLGKLIVPDTKKLGEKYDYVEVTENNSRTRYKKTFGNLIFRIERNKGSDKSAYYIDIPEVKCTFTIASISGVVYNNFVVPGTSYPSSYEILDKKIGMIGNDYLLFERLFKPADLAPPEYFSEVPASFRSSQPTYEELLQIKTDFLQYFRVMEPVPIEEAVQKEERATKRAKK